MFLIIDEDRAIAISQIEYIESFNKGITIITKGGSQFVLDRKIYKKYNTLRQFVADLNEDISIRHHKSIMIL
jgi:hypothetical protein